MERRVERKLPDIQAERNRSMTLREQFRWARVTKDPYLTQHQLAILARTDTGTISDFENGTGRDIRMQTLRRLAHALGFEVSIKLTKKPSRSTTAYTLEGPALRPPPKLIRRATAQGRWQALEFRRLKGKISPRSRHSLGSKYYAGRTKPLDPDNPFDFDETELRAKHRGRPRPSKKTQKAPG